ncbi:glycosyltransferase family 4 protein [Hymenobacter wooponensis]|uniref:Glycosyltransferase family 1 protein n=1 Tax=Hymenobacter wooponensis TaxID=1525360 RepID=A0A4Z0MUJ8_9BACT|nr:glycosyltransferase family 4 protein [Hymenobacter wooponensis]TGD82988.1 glycosyltransferase family 1 protein [Hymenobacter wooponensis]
MASSPVRVTYVIAHINKALSFEWIASFLDKQKIELSFILLNTVDTELERFLRERGLPVVRVSYRGKSDLFSAIVAVKAQLKRWQSQVVHTHLFDANVVGLLAARFLGIPKRILTRHHSTYHHQYFPRAVYYDRFTNTLATHIVAITQMVKQVLIKQEQVSPSKVRLIHHGFDLAMFMQPQADQVAALRVKYAINDSYPVVGVIARQTELKGIQYIIPAFAELRKKYPKALLVLANAQGDYHAQVQALLQQYLSKDAYKQVPFENDLVSLYQLFDVYVHTPIADHSEAFGQTYVEALASGIPSVFTLSGVAPEFIRHEDNALIVPFMDSEAIYKAIERLLSDPVLCERLRVAGVSVVAEQFTLKRYLCALEQLYCE